MFCMKCGKKTEEKQAFCNDCLAVMAKYPVKPEVKIFLPHSTPTTVVKKSVPKKKALPPEEQISRLRKALLRVSFALAIAVLALVLSVALLVESFHEDVKEDVIGQNYGTIEHTN